jgi:hypothetical protein
MSEPISFKARCPKCGQERLQLSHTRSALLSELNTNREIVAYCLPCDEFWSINEPDRSALTDGLLQAHCRPDSGI